MFHPMRLVERAELEHVFCCLLLSSAGALLCIADFQFVEKVVLQTVVACSEPENAHLLSTSEQVVLVLSVEAWVVLFPQLLLLGLDDGFRFTVGGRLVLLPFCSTFLGQFVCSVVAVQLSVGGYPL